MGGLEQQYRDSANPLDRVEHVAHRHEWFVDRAGEDEVNMIVASSWGDLNISLNWREDVESLHIACSFEAKVPHTRREEIGRLINLVNEESFFGHFDLWRQDGSIVFRNGLILSGGASVNDAQCEALITVAVDACERYYPSFQFVIWAGKTAEEAIEASLLDTMGQA
jgi:hypothetical protein